MTWQICMDGSALGPLRRDNQRLVKSPKVYVRDSGLAHALLGITTLEDLVGHPRRSRRASIWRVPISSHTGPASSILAKSGSR